jgi:hypothetical protein
MNVTCASIVRNDQAVILNPGLGDKLLCTATDDMIESFSPLDDGNNWHNCLIRVD